MNPSHQIIMGNSNGNRLYNFTSHTFTNCGASGRSGPTIAQIVAAYAGTSLAGKVSQGYFQGYQRWIVPITGQYKITVSGGSAAAANGGAGMIFWSVVTLNAGETLEICIGHNVTSRTYSSSGGAGGTFVARSSTSIATATPICIAGGGGGTYNGSFGSNMHASNTIFGKPGSGESNGGTNGNGGTAAAFNSPFGGSGGGFFSSGAATRNCALTGGDGFKQGLLGGSTCAVVTGSFGGGAGTHGSSGGGGGGGGYSGGGGCGHIQAGGGGGGSYSIEAINEFTFSTNGYTLMEYVG